MNKVEKIKAEIKRLKNELIQEVEKGYKSEFDEGRISAFEDMITLINSFEEEPISNGLEEAAKNYEEDAIFYAARRISDFFKAGAQWQKDTFIEKTCEFFGEHLWKYINVKNANCDTFINIDGDKLKEDFKKYIKGE